MPPRVAGATTAVRTPRAVACRDGDVMNERIEVVPRHGDDPPRAQDACRVGIMRRITAARLRYCGLETMVDEVLVIVSELVTNAVLHSGTAEIGLKVALQEGLLRIEVRDGMEGSAKPKHPDHSAESGRGLVLVQGLVEENGGAWGVSDDGTTVWCDLPATGEGQ
ncbi:ATP-binding protein [Streptomyces mirabilis]|uniref:ATP-binding protein n=1 Tax=Streptomyces mirabilis TaxID=68239 RepID=UPI0036DEDB6D